MKRKFKNKNINNCKRKTKNFEKVSRKIRKTEEKV